MTSSAFQVSCAASRDAALPMLGEHFDVMLMDGQMPGMSAPEFLAKVRETSPQTQVILMSGAFDQSEAARLGIHYFLSKPFTLQDVLAILTTATATPVEQH
jgi:CheY-like chemotaxis protein